MIRVLTLALFFCMCTVLAAQNDCDAYEQIIQKVKTAAANGAFRVALTQLKAARACDPSKQAEIDDWYDTVFDGIDQQRQRAEKAQKEAKIQATEARRHEAAALESKAKADSALTLANNIIDALYFYKDSFALAFKNSRFGFINKKGEAVINYRYTEALPFDHTGYARVKLDGQNFLVDTKGENYRLASELSQLDSNTRALDLRYKGWDTFPTKILRHPGLKIMFLSGNRFKQLPAEIGRLEQLKALYLSESALQELPAEISNLALLQTLELSYNQIDSLPSEIGKLTNLQFLNLKHNRLKLLPSEIGNLVHLQSLELSANRLNALPAEIGKLTKLQLLDLETNKLSTLPSEISNLTKLQTLNLHSNQLEVLPPGIGKCTDLQVLNLTFNQLNSLPIEIGKLTRLQYLNLFTNKLSILPSSIGNLTELLSLELSENKLGSLPPEIGGLENLQSLQVSSNQLKVVPSEIGRLAHLHTLYLSNNQLRTIPPEVANLTKLRFLNLNSNQLSSLPPEMDKLTNLQSLHLKSNKLSFLPFELRKLSELQSLELRSNPNLVLSSLFVNMANTTKNLSFSSTDYTHSEEGFLLVKIDSVRSIPAEIGKLTNLQLLDLPDNKLSSIPVEIAKLTKLRSVNLSGNPLNISSLTPELIKLHSLNVLDLRRISKLDLGVLFTSIAEVSKKISISSISSINSSLVEDELLVKIDSVRELPAEIGKLSNLHSLVLEANQVSVLPPEIGLLTNLQTLNLYKNQLSTLPPEIGQLTNLEYLDLESNKISSLPLEIGKLTKLERLLIKRNLLNITELQKLPAKIYLDNLQYNAGYLHQERKYKEAFTYYQALAKLKLDDGVKSRAAAQCSNITWFLLFEKEFKLSLEAGLLALQFDETNSNLYTNLPLAYLFNDQYGKAKEIYVEYINKKYVDGRTYKEVFLTDFADLEKAGVTHPDIAKIKALLGE